MGAGSARVERRAKRRRTERLPAGQFEVPTGGRPRIAKRPTGVKRPVFPMRLQGIDFKNHPNLERLILADDWPEGVYPLRKDWKNEKEI